MIPDPARQLLLGFRTYEASDAAHGAMLLSMTAIGSGRVKTPGRVPIGEQTALPALLLTSGSPRLAAARQA